jgi:hypothetical protein
MPLFEQAWLSSGRSADLNGLYSPCMCSQASTCNQLPIGRFLVIGISVAQCAYTSRLRHCVELLTLRLLRRVLLSIYVGCGSCILQPGHQGTHFNRLAC